MADHHSDSHFFEIGWYVVSSLILLSACVAWAAVPHVFPEWTISHIGFPGPAVTAVYALGAGNEHRIRQARCEWNLNQTPLCYYLRHPDARLRQIAVLACQYIDVEIETRAALYLIATTDVHPSARAFAHRYLITPHDLIRHGYVLLERMPRCCPAIASASQ